MGCLNPGMFAKLSTLGRSAAKDLSAWAVSVDVLSGPRIPQGCSGSAESSFPRCHPRIMAAVRVTWSGTQALPLARDLVSSQSSTGRHHREAALAVGTLPRRPLKASSQPLPSRPGGDLAVSGQGKVCRMESPIDGLSASAGLVQGRGPYFLKKQA